ncbi:bacterio-opsin activator-like protein [Natrinema pellirubrum DSM 15624]|uniref:Bacterio-opsin activator-like protein n=1 Tax=Natrinema pellirubrum (strain DSM 15624 / CIP 106293 / JCM 10476 / NCIMB 786 / 157) TaxID=797303 RepID=L0JM50_NATP1|nr:bacterio-opsin activator domain-containing protein [Natrinema pellirubrum]AGB31662.1 putative DNA binding protein [Natrinema pellirubrum DSM 15624]ELY73031.1 bacterio-opsin activator-like protein [Natrinema pellirubrum DSM 15624]
MTDRFDDETAAGGSGSDAMDERLQRAPIGIIETAADGRVVDVNDAAATLLETDPSALRGTAIGECFPKSADGTLRETFGGPSPTPASFEEYYPLIDRWLAVDVHVDEGTLVYVRDRTPQKETEQTVDRIDQRLDRIQRINSLVATVLQQVIGTSDRSDIARTVCEQLGGTDLYRFAWVGDRSFSEERLRVLAAAGDAADLRERIGESLEDERTVPGQAAVTSGKTQRHEAIAEDDTVPRGIRRAAFGHGLQSCLAVPLAYQGTVYGVVTVYTDREDGFSDQERVALETLGGVAGFAINAGQQEDLLVADTGTEVTVEVRGETVPFVGAAREADRALSLAGAIPRGDGAVVCYLTADGPLEGVDESLTDCEAVANVRRIRDETEPLLQATVSGETPVTALAAWGATIEGGEYGAESARLVAEVPSDGDVRRLLEAVDAVVSETQLVAKRETTRAPEPTEGFRDTLDERLTDRQRTVLRTAHLSDYFTSPRGSSSAEVAETLDIAGSTMLYHLRRAEQKLVEAFFDADSPTEAGGSDAARDDVEPSTTDGT